MAESRRLRLGLRNHSCWFESRSRQGRPGLNTHQVHPSNGKKLIFFCFFVFSCFSRVFAHFLVFLSVFFVFFVSLEPICIVVHHHMWHLSSSLVTLSHICLVDIGNLDRSIRSLPRCGVAIVQLHRVLWEGIGKGSWAVGFEVQDVVGVSFMGRVKWVWQGLQWWKVKLHAQ